MPTAPVPMFARGKRSARAPRISQALRGYDSRWERLRDWHRDRFPLCAHCLTQGIVRIMREVDHIIPFTSLQDPNRLNPNNLQSLCAPCHRAKTRKEYARG